MLGAGAQALVVFQAVNRFQYITQAENTVLKCYIQCWRITTLDLLIYGMWTLLEGPNKIWANVLRVGVWELKIGLNFVVNSIQLASAELTNPINNFQFTDVRK